jgi:hypothetical protein
MEDSMGKNDIYIVRRPFITEGRRIVRRGTRMLGNDPLVKGNEHLFELASDGFDVEQATARPGEKRNVQPVQETKEPTKAELLDQAKDKGVKVNANATKAEIAEALEEA